MQKLYSHDNFSLNSPDSLQSICIIFAIGDVKTFVMCKKMTLNSKGTRKASDMLGSKCDLTDHDDNDGRMFEIPGNANANLV